MKLRLLPYILPILLLGCANITPQQQQAGAALFDTATGIIASRTGLSPADTKVITDATNQLWGAYAQANALQPPANGTTIPSLGNALTYQLPKNPAQAAPILLAAAQQGQ